MRETTLIGARHCSQPTIDEITMCFDIKTTEVVFSSLSAMETGVDDAVVNV